MTKKYEKFEGCGIRGERYLSYTIDGRGVRIVYTHLVLL